MGLERGEIKIWLTRSGEVMVWLGNEARVPGSLLQLYGNLGAYQTEGQTGRLGAFDIEVIDYDFLRDVYHIRRLSYSHQDS